MNKKILIFLILIFSLTRLAKSQGTLPYTQDNICLDQLIPVNSGSFGITNAKNLVVADFNNDGIKEVLVADANLSLIKIYSFLPSTGTFTFQNAINVPGSFGDGKKQAVDFGKFNSDGFLDLVFTTDSFIYVFKNQTNFVFNLFTGCQIPIPNNFIGVEHHLKVDDANNDGFDDFYFVSPNIATGPGIIVTPYMNSGSATFIQQSFHNVFPTTTLTALTTIDISIGDIKGDLNGKNDVMITCNIEADKVYFLENFSLVTALSYSATPVFLTPQIPFSTPYFKISSSELADLNGDTKLDFIFYGSTPFTDNISIYGGTNSFNLNFPLNINSNGLKINDFKLADLNNDNRPDFIGAGTYSNTAFSGLVLYEGNSNPANYLNQTPVLLTFTNTLIRPDELQIADVDNNGLKDLVIKPSRINSDKTYLIPNFSFKVNVTATPSVICGLGGATLTAANTSTSTNYNWEFIPTTSVVSTNTSFTTDIAGTYLASLDIDMYSAYTCTQKSDTIKIISAAPIITLSTPNNLTVCSGKTLTTVASGAATYTWISSQSGFITNNPTLFIPGISANTFTVFGQLTNGCKGSTTLTLSLAAPNTDNIEASKNPACRGDAITLNFPPSAVSSSWNTSETTSSIVVTPNTQTLYQLTIKDGNGCTSFKSITIEVDPNCGPVIYHGISLNGDGNNDYFRIDNIENYKNNRVVIFNRWGREIFSTNDYNNTSNYWPSKNNSNDILPTTYFYMINFGDGSEIQKGWIEVIKN